MIGSMDYTKCDDCPISITCCENILKQLRCYSCIHYVQGVCTVYGKLPDMRGCCGLAVQIKLAECFGAVVVANRDFGIECCLVDCLGCEECMKEWEERQAE